MTCRRCAQPFELRDATDRYCLRCIAEVDAILAAQDRRADAIASGPAWLRHAAKDMTGHVRRAA